jgi:tripartite-type tricarboxylate transporter receptor subunit TctC
MNPFRSCIFALGAIVLAMSPVSEALAQEYPDRRITLVVPYAAGGAADAVARLIANRLSESWKQTVTIENKTGGGGIIGNDYVAKSSPDGYTVLVGISQLVQAPNVGTKLPYDLFRDFIPVTQAVILGSAFAVPAKQPEKTLEEFVAAAKADPGKVSYGSYGNATTAHLFGELFKKKAGIDMAHVPYRGASPLTNDLIGGQVNAAFVEIATALPQLKAGTIRALAVPGEKRIAQLPDVKTFAELGYSGFEARGWIGFFLPAKTPAHIVKKLDDELSRIIKSPDIAAKIEGMSLVPVGDGSQAFAAMIRREFDRWAAIAQEADVKVE